MMFSSGPERKEVVQAPGELVATVSIDSLEKTANDPEIHCQDVELTCDKNPDDGAKNSTKSQNHDFDWRRVFSGKAEWSRVLVVDLVDVLVERAPMHCAMCPIMPRILQDEKDGNVESHCLPAGERDTGIHAAEFCHWVEEPDLGKFDCEMTEENEFGTRPLFLRCGDLLILDLVPVKKRYLVYYDPRQTSSEVYDFVHDEAHDTGCEDIVLHVLVPALHCLLVSNVAVCWRLTYGPEALKNVEMHIVL